MFLKGVFVDVQSQSAVEVLEEDASHVVALADDDGVLLAQLVKIGEGGSEHRVSGDIAESRGVVILLQVGLHRRYVADDTVLWQVRQHFLERRYGVFHCYGIYDEFRCELLHLVECGKSLAVVCKPHSLRVFLIHRRLVVETEQVEEETSHLTCPQY